MRKHRKYFCVGGSLRLVALLLGKLPGSLLQPRERTPVGGSQEGRCQCFVRSVAPALCVESKT